MGKNQETALAKQEAKGTLITLDALLADPKAIRSLPFEDVVRTLQAQNDIVDAAEEYGDGAVVFRKDDKRKLVGIPMVLFDWTYSEGVGESGEKVTLRLKLSDNSIAIVNDGSSGIYQQMKELDDRPGGRTKALYLKNGLRASDYTTTINGKETEATTYYLADLPIPRRRGE